jgi:5-methylcytosine-specific restriction endonuclease McrA
MTVGRNPAYQTAEWKRHQRKRVYERDGYRCRKCGALGKQKGGKVTLSLQHMLPERLLRRLGRPAVDSELVTLCLSCHGKMDGGRRYARTSWNGGVPR